MATPNIYGELPPELLGDQRAIERQQKIAEALMAQGMAPLGAGRMVGNTFVPPHWAEGLAKLAQAYVGSEGVKKADAGMKDIGSRYSQMYADEIAKVMNLRSGSAPRPQQMSADDMAMIADQGGETAPTTQDVKPASQQQIIDAMIASKIPDFRKQGLTMMAQEPALALRREEGAENRAARIQERILSLEAAAQNAALSREERAARAKEAAELRREMQQNQFANQRDMARLGASLRTPPQPQPLVQIVGADGKPTWVERKDAIGKTPAGAGSKAESIAAGKAEIDRDVVTLKAALDQLKEGGGITSTEKGVIPNVGSWAANTAVGQTLGSMGGTTNQKARDVVSQARPLLLRSIMQATGMSAKNLDSNAELKLWLATATDPTKGYEANIEALNNIAEKYGSGGFMDKSTTAQPKKNSLSAEDAQALAWANANPSDPRAAQIKQRLGQ